VRERERHALKKEETFWNFMDLGGLSPNR
jgi:hypothetical protein